MTHVLLTIDELSPDSTGTLIATLISGDGATVTLPAGLLPADARVGDVLQVSLTIDPEESARRRDAVAELQRKLFG
jgi:hypothetical protein